MEVNPFVVSIHDVAPLSERQVLRQLDRLRPLVGINISVAVIPAGAGGGWHDASARYLEALHPLERLLHGCHHSRPFSWDPISCASGYNDEFAGLEVGEMERRLLVGQKVLKEVFGRPANGFLPPAWRSGELDLEQLSRRQISFHVGYCRLKRIGGHPLPLATYSWDWGPAAFWGRFGSVVGDMCSWRRGAVPVIALHPCDEARGYLIPALEMIRRLLGRGFTPVRFHELMEHAS